VSDDIVTRLRVLLSKCCIAPAMAVWSQDLRDAADEIERLRAERDEARREVLLWVKERCSWVELTAEIKTRGWEYLKEASDDRSKR